MEEHQNVKKRKEIPVSCTWATEDLFVSDAAWEAACRDMEKALAGYETYKGHLGESAKTLYDCLRFDAYVGENLDRIVSYARLCQDVDLTDEHYQEMAVRAQQLETAAAAASSFLSAEILEIPEERLREFQASREADRAFDRSLESMIRDRAHIRSQEVEKLLADASEMASGPSRIFQMFNNADIQFPMIRDEDGHEVRLTHGRYVSFLESRDRRVRKEAFQAMYETFGKSKNTLAAVFQANVKRTGFYARARKYPSARAYCLSDANIPETVYDTLIETVRKSLPLMYRYVALRKKALKTEDLHMYDLYVSIVPEVNRTFSYDEAKEEVRKALAPMGADYLDILEKGFSERWIDYMENEGKRSGAYSCGPYGSHPFVLMSWQNRLDDVFTLAHEMGHAIHSWLSNQNQPFADAQYKIFVAEVASTCNENLLNHALLEKTSDSRERAVILNHFLDGFKGTVVRQTMFAEFEKTVHEMAGRGEALTAGTLCRIYRQLNEDYFGPDITVDDEIAMEWARIPHFYTPFYVYQYATGFSAAVFLSEKILSGDQQAAEAYMNFLKGGNSKDPIDLLADAGVDMRTPEPVKAAMEVFRRALDEMEALLG